MLALLPTRRSIVAEVRGGPGAGSSLLGYFVMLALAFGVVIAAICRSERPWAGPDDSPIERAEAGDVADVVEPGRGEPEAPGAQPNPYAAPGPS